jgi:hypothetical protein
MIVGAVTGMPEPQVAPPPTVGMHLGWETLETCDRCGTGVNAIWLVFTKKGDLTFCGKHYRDFCQARGRK